MVKELALKEQGDVPVENRWWLPHEERQALIKASTRQPMVEPDERLAGEPKPVGMGR